MTSGTTERDDIKYIENRLNRAGDSGYPSMNLNNGYSASENRKYSGWHIDDAIMPLTYVTYV